jgi:glyceraldehyde 3-phosphate dehydrogenase
MTDIGSCQLDVGKIAIAYKNSDKSLSPAEFLRQLAQAALVCSLMNNQPM